MRDIWQVENTVKSIQRRRYHDKLVLQLLWALSAPLIQLFQKLLINV